MKDVSKLLQGRGQIFDAFVLLANLFLVGPLTELVRATKGFHPLFGFLLIFAVLAYSAGAWLKRDPLQARLAKRTGETAMVFYVLLFVLFVMHLGLFIACLSFALEILNEGGLWAWAGTETAAAAAMVLGLLPTIYALRAFLPLRHEVSSDKESAPIELIADFAIYLALIVLLAWWNGVFVEMTVTLPPQHWAMEILLSLLMLVPFAMFYLAPRILFLVEDYRRPSSWLTIALAVMPLVWRS